MTILNPSFQFLYRQLSPFHDQICALSPYTLQPFYIPFSPNIFLLPNVDFPNHDKIPAYDYSCLQIIDSLQITFRSFSFQLNFLLSQQ